MLAARSKLGVQVGGVAPEREIGHQGAPHGGVWPSRLVEQVIEVAAALAELRGREHHAVPHVGVAGREGHRPPEAVATNEDAWAARAFWSRQQQRPAQVEEPTVVRHGLVAAQQPRDDLQPLFEARHPCRQVAQLVPEESMLALLPARA